MYEAKLATQYVISTPSGVAAHEALTPRRYASKLKSRTLSARLFLKTDFHIFPGCRIFTAWRKGAPLAVSAKIWNAKQKGVAAGIPATNSRASSFKCGAFSFSSFAFAEKVTAAVAAAPACFELAPYPLALRETFRIGQVFEADQFASRALNPALLAKPHQLKDIEVFCKLLLRTDPEFSQWDLYVATFGAEFFRAAVSPAAVRRFRVLEQLPKD